jgi:hypothetical protein
MQSYENHRHRPRLARAGFILLFVAIVGLTLSFLEIGGRYSMALGLGALTATVLVLLLISRVYVTALQDRIIRLEMEVRASALLQPAQLERFRTLSKRQVIALRFAPDAELPELVERAARESLSADAIKRAIRQWRPDLDRT